MTDSSILTYESFMHGLNILHGVDSEPSQTETAVSSEELHYIFLSLGFAKQTQDGIQAVTTLTEKLVSASLEEFPVLIQDRIAENEIYMNVIAWLHRRKVSTVTSLEIANQLSELSTTKNSREQLSAIDRAGCFVQVCHLANLGEARSLPKNAYELFLDNDLIEVLLQVSPYPPMTFDAPIAEQISVTPKSEFKPQIGWWGRYHNHVYGIGSLLLGAVGLLYAMSSSNSSAREMEKVRKDLYQKMASDYQDVVDGVVETLRDSDRTPQTLEMATQLEKIISEVEKNSTSGLTPDIMFRIKLAKATVALSKAEYKRVFELLPTESIEDSSIALDDRISALRLHSMAFRRQREWKSSVMSDEAVLKLRKDDWLAKSAIAACQINLEDYETAIKTYDELLVNHEFQLEKNDYYVLHQANAYNNRGIARDFIGEYSLAVADFETTISLIKEQKRPLKYQYVVTLAIANNNLGSVFSSENKPEAAIVVFDEAIKILEEIDSSALAINNRDDLAMAFVNRGQMKSRLDRDAEAIIDFEKGIAIRRQLLVEGYEEYRHSLANSINNLAIHFYENQLWDDAIKLHSEAIGLCNHVMPKAPTEIKLDLTYFRACRAQSNYAASLYAEAIVDVKAVFQLFVLVEAKLNSEPTKRRFRDTISILNSMAWDYSTSPDSKKRNGNWAVEISTVVCDYYQEWEYLDTLAVAFAESGDFESAIKFQNNARDILNSKQSEYAPEDFEVYLSDIDNQLELYENKKPFHKTKPEKEGDV